MESGPQSETEFRSKSPKDRKSLFHGKLIFQCLFKILRVNVLLDGSGGRGFDFWWIDTDRGGPRRLREEREGRLTDKGRGRTGEKRK